MSRPLQLPVTATLDAAEPWRVNLGSAFQDLVPGALDDEPSPQGSLSGLRLGPVGVFTVSGTPQVVQRTTSAVRRSPGDLIKVCVQLHGRATVRQGRHEVCLDPGELAVYDTGRPYRIRLEGAWTCAVMALPRDAIGLSESDLDRWMHPVYPATHGPGSVLSHFVVSTVTHPRPLGAAAAAKLGEAGSTLLAGTLLDDGDLMGTDATDDMRAHVIGFLRRRPLQPRVPAALRVPALAAETGRRASLTPRSP